MDAEAHEVVCGRCVAIFPLEGVKVTIGRDQNAHITSLSQWASRCHCYFERRPTHWCIVDNSSSNGVYVDGKQITAKHPFILKNGMEISLGPSDLTIGRYQFWYTSTYTHPAAKKQHTSRGKSKDRVGCRGIGCKRKPEGEHSSSRDSSPEEFLPLRQRVAYNLATQKNCSPYLIDMADPRTRKWSDDDDSSQSDIEEPSTSLNTPKRKTSKNPRKRKLSTKSDSGSSQQKQVVVAKSRLDELKAIETKHNKMLKEGVVIPEKRYQELLETERKYDSEVKTREEILTKTYAEELEKNFLCPICATVYIKAVTLSCGHTFCSKCMETWKVKSSQCAMCRVDVKGEYKNRVLDDYIESMVNKAGNDYIEQRKQAIIDHEFIGTFFTDTEKNDDILVFDDDVLFDLNGEAYFEEVQIVE